MATTKRNRATAADIAAAVALGTIDPTAEVLTPAEAAAERAESVQESARLTAERDARTPAPVLSGDHHECAITGCRHGAAVHGAPQPDRQLKLAAECGAVIRLTARALATAGGTITDGHGHPFAIAPRRTYSRRAK